MTEEDGKAMEFPMKTDYHLDWKRKLSLHTFPWNKQKLRPPLATYMYVQRCLSLSRHSICLFILSPVTDWDFIFASSLNKSPIRSWKTPFTIMICHYCLDLFRQSPLRSFLLLRSVPLQSPLLEVSSEALILLNALWCLQTKPYLTLFHELLYRHLGCYLRSLSSTPCAQNYNFIYHHHHHQCL